MKFFLAALMALFISSSDSAADLFPIDIDVNQWHGTPLDFSYLNTPLTPGDRIIVRGSDFYRIGMDGRAGTADDQPIRFFGVNLSFSANFPKAAEAERLAERLRYLGVNIVRIHHIDTVFAEPGAESRDGVLKEGRYPLFDDEAVARLRYLIVKLAEAGIYTDLNLHVGYQFDVRRDRLKTVPADFVFPAKSKPYQLLLPELIQRQKEYGCELVRRLGLARNPALALLELNNESSVVFAWQRGGLEPESLGSDPAGLRMGWQRFQRVNGWMPVVGPVSFRKGRWQSKVRYAQFLAGLDKKYLGSMRETMRACVGTEVPVTGTQIGFGGLINQLSHASMDYLDEHFYVDHYKFPHGWQHDDWYITNTSLALEEFAPLPGIATLQQRDKPFTVSEFNQAWPNRYGHEIDISTAAFALIQGWDAIMHFNYSNDDRFEERVPKGFNLHGDAARLVAFGQSAKLFRELILSPPPLAIDFTPSEAYALAAAGIRQKDMANTVRANRQLHAELLLNSRVSSSITHRKRKRIAPALRDEPISFHPDEKRMLVRTSQVWAVSGKVVAGELGRPDFSLRFTGKPPELGMAVLSSLDSRPVIESARLLLSLPGPVWRSTPAEAAGRQQLVPEKVVRYRLGWTVTAETGRPSASLRAGRAPVWMHRPPVFVNLQVKQGRPKVFPLDGAGRRLPPLADGLIMRKASGMLSIDLTSTAARASPWYELVIEDT